MHRKSGKVYPFVNREDGLPTAVDTHEQIAMLRNPKTVSREALDEYTHFALATRRDAAGDQTGADPRAAAADYIDPEKEVENADDALAGARDIIAEIANEDYLVHGTGHALHSLVSKFLGALTLDRLAANIDLDGDPGVSTGMAAASYRLIAYPSLMELCRRRQQLACPRLSSRHVKDDGPQAKVSPNVLLMF